MKSGAGQALSRPTLPSGCGETAPQQQGAAQTGVAALAKSLRRGVVCLAAGSVGLSMALISISKLALFVCGLLALLAALLRRRAVAASPFAGLACPALVLLALLAFALSLVWSSAPATDALASLSKYGKLIVILLMVLLIRTRRDAMLALAAFGATQIFLLTSSWLLFAGLSLPWATSNMAATEYAVFSSYLDQGIISAAFAGICWHLRELMPTRLGRGLALFVAAAAMGNVLFVLSGRSGHVVAIALLSLAIMWQLPRRLRPLAVVLPFALLAALFLSSPKVRERVTLMQGEIQSYASHDRTDSSSGIRLGLWLASARMVQQQPLLGSGVGSWYTEFLASKRQEDQTFSEVNGHFNPHQEYLLWAVQLGVPGLLLLLALMLAVWRDAAHAAPPVARATQSTVAALAFACLFNSSLYDALIGDFFCVSLGLLLALGRHSPAHADNPGPGCLSHPA